MSEILIHDLTGLALMIVWAVGTPLVSRFMANSGDVEVFAFPAAIALALTGVFGIGFIHFFLAVHDTPGPWIAPHFFGVLIVVGLISRFAWKYLGHRSGGSSAVGETSAA